MSRRWRSVFLVIATTATGAWAFNRYRVKTLRRQRANYGRADFLVDCQQRGLSGDIAAVVWDWFMEHLGRDQFPLLPSDSLSTQLRIVEEDVDDAVVEIARRSGRRRPTRRDVVRRPPVRTVADLITLVSSVPHTDR